MGRFFGTRIRSRFTDSDFSFPKSTNLRRCTKRTQNLDFVYFQFPLTACKIPVAVESETGTHVRSVRTEATIFYIFSFAEVGYLTHQIITTTNALWTTIILHYFRRKSNPSTTSLQLLPSSQTTAVTARF